MAAEVLPSIRVTDPHAPTQTFSTSKGSQEAQTQAPLNRHGDQPIRDAVPSLRIQTIAHATDSPLPGSSERPQSACSIDPLSQHIMDRTRNVLSHQKSRSQADNFAPPPAPLAGRDPADARHSVDAVATDVSPQFQRDRRKGVSFFARFIGNKKKEIAEEMNFGDSELGDDRPEGADVQAFSQSVDNISFNPQHPQPPPYIKVRAKYKKRRDFNKVFLAQELHDKTRDEDVKVARDWEERRLNKLQPTDGNAVWAVEFSKDGRYLATAGQDTKIRIWSVLASREDRGAFGQEEEAWDGSDRSVHLSAPVFQPKSVRKFESHTGPVLDLSWSKNNFLLSSSMDKTVRLWHASRNECLCAFRHSDFVTSIQFHPKDDRFFLAGSLDSKLRLWSIPDKSVGFWSQLPEMITAVSFTPDGKQAIAGCLSGLCMFYETEGLRYQTQIHVKSAHGKNAKGSKITGIQTMHVPPPSHGAAQSSSSDIKVLITSNDSRIRLYNLRDKSLEMKFKGYMNDSSQIHARFSDDARYVICASEDKRVFIWSTQPEEMDMKKNRWPVEMFEAHGVAATASIVAPTRSRQHLSASEDPIYDLCNPPPVTLVSRSEIENELPTSIPKTLTASSGDSHRSASIRTTQAKAENGGLSSHSSEPPAYVSRSAHLAGNIIVTADASGAIKVFRQDCASEKRKASDASSIKRASTSLIRKSSLATSTRSQRSNLSRQSSGVSIPQKNPSRERVFNWRQSIAGSRRSIDRTSATSGSPMYRGQTRSASPWKNSPSLGVALASSQNSSPVAGPGSTSTPPIEISNAGSFDSRKASFDTTSSMGQSIPQKQRSLGQNMTVDGNGNSASASLPVLTRNDSSTYWQRDAWHNAFVEQLKNSHLDKKFTRSGDNLNVEEDTRRKSSAATSTSDVGLMPPVEQKLSNFSTLTSASPSPSPSSREESQNRDTQARKGER